jgi:NadR type nicotinamide-nucleotide adenylyltransferase
MENKTHKMILRIAVTGPESTGKSVLAEQLAGHYCTKWVPEFARDYLNKLGHPYEEYDIVKIALGQIKEEDKYLEKARSILFCDTEPIVTKIWSEVKYNRCDPRIIKMISTRPYDLFLLCDIDLPWEPDPLREHPHKRKFLFDLYHKELTSRNFPFVIVRGEGPVRLACAISAIETFFRFDYEVSV